MLLAYHQWTLETPLWFGIILWFLVLFGFLVLSQLWRSVGSIGAKWHSWRARKRLAQANNLTLRAMLETLEGYYDSAGKNFAKTIHNAELPLLNLLGAAYCAERQQQQEVRNDYLDKALVAVPEAETAIKLIKIQWLIEATKWHEAAFEIDHLLTNDPYQKQALFLAQTLYQRLGSWDKLLKVTTTLRKRKLINQESFENTQLKAYCAQLNDSANHEDFKKLNTQWLTLPSSYQLIPQLVLIYAKALIQAEQGDKAAELINDTLKKHWDEELVYWYGEAVSTNAETQLKQAEKWLASHENNPLLLLTLGRLCIRTNLWGKARSYLEASAHIKAKPETYLALAQLAQGHGEMEKAMVFYQKGLNLALAK
jgi:HemY protein